MKVTRWGTSAIAALLLASGVSFAGDTDDLNSMKATMENMKQEMETMRSSMASEREALRANAGGAPESLKSANGKATVKIGGNFQVRYNVSYENGYQGSSTQYANTRYTRTNWDIYKAELNFTIDFTPDTSGYLVLRPDRGSASVGQLLDQVWWKWNNIGGTGFGTKVGLQKLDLGMYNGSANPWDRVMILDPFVKTAAKFAGQSYTTSGTTSNNSLFGSTGATHASDITAIGVSADYKWDQFKVVAGIYGQRVANDDGMDNTLGVTTNGTARNIDIENHFITTYYDPCWLEGLHLQASYFGEFDQGAAATSGTSGTTWFPSDYTASTASNHGSTYVPGFDFGVSYKADKWAVYGEALVVVNPNYYSDSVQMAYSAGADYSLTEKLKVGGSFDWMSYLWDRTYTNGSPIESYTLRGALAAKYDFGNGLYVQAQYSHYWVKTWGIADSKCKDADAVTLQTGFKF